MRGVLTTRDKKRLLGKVVELGVSILMRNHIYQFEGKSRIQREGGSIGIAATGVVARIRMMRWGRRFKEICKRNNLELEMFKVYVDDENQLWRLMEQGRRWNGTHMEWRREWYEEDKESTESRETVMMREVLGMANSIEKDIQLTVDTPSNHRDKKLPVLDLKMWVEDRVGERGEEYQEVVHEFFEKEMVAPRLISKESALPTRVKMTTLTQEVIRIRKNTSGSIREKVKVAQMSRFAMKLMLSGYNKTERREILMAGMRGFERLEELEKNGKRSLNRNRKENYEARLLKKHGARSNWYKGRGEGSREEESRRRGSKKVDRVQKRSTEQQVEAVMFVPATPEGELARLIQEADDKMREGSGDR